MKTWVAVLLLLGVAACGSSPTPPPSCDGANRHPINKNIVPEGAANEPVKIQAH